jgi:hypothetical protein
MALVLGILAYAVFVVGVHRVLVPQPGVKEFTEAVPWTAGVVFWPMAGAVMAFAAIFAAAFIRRPGVAALVIGTALALDLFANNPRVPLDRPGPLSRDTSFQLLDGVARSTDERATPFRVDCPPRQGKLTYIIVNTALGARVEVVNGYSPMAIGRFYRFVHFMRGQKPSNKTRHELPEVIYKVGDAFSLRILNVRYATKWDEEGQRFRPVETTPLPRAWIVDRAEVVADEQASLERVRDPGFDPATTVILESPPRIAMTPSPTGESVGHAVTKRLAPGLLEIRTQSARDGYLVLSEIFYPGWKATIDGEPVQLERADHLITALPLPSGTHTVMYEYDPLSFKIGAAGSAITWLAAVSIGLVDFRRRLGSATRSRAPAAGAHRRSPQASAAACWRP